MILSPETLANSTSPIGGNVVRKEGEGKVLGRAQYVDDLVFPNMLHGMRRCARRLLAGAFSTSRFSDAIDWSEFTIVTAKDIPGRNTIVHLLEDHVCLADGFRESPRGADPPACARRQGKAARRDCRH